MLSGALDKVTGLFDPRLLATTFFPVLVFWALTAAVVIGSQGDLVQAARTVADQQLTATSLQTIGFIIGVAFTSSVVASQQLNLLRLLEGYWASPPGRLFATLGRRWHQARLSKLDAIPEGYSQIYFGYPPRQPP